VQDDRKHPAGHEQDRCTYAEEHFAKDRRDLKRSTTVVAAKPIAHVIRRLLKLVLADTTVWHGFYKSIA